ncbi:MAG: hypothetical protein Q7R68_11065 [Nitrospirales bacterium]|nr:hypothetical protein [Nitrospirales bacterium]
MTDAQDRERAGNRLFIWLCIGVIYAVLLSTCWQPQPAFACDQFPILGPEQQVGEPTNQADGLVVVEFDRDGDGVVDHALLFQRGSTGTMLKWPLFYAYGKKGAHRLYVDKGSPHPMGRCEDIVPKDRYYSPKEQA